MLRTEAKITQLITDFARLDPAADGTISLREFKAALAKHGGFLDEVGDSLAARFGVASRRSDLPMTEVDYVAFLAYLEDAVDEQKQKYHQPQLQFASQHHQHQQRPGALREGNLNRPTNRSSQPQLPSETKNLSFVDRALSNASKALLNHTSGHSNSSSRSPSAASIKTTTVTPVSPHPTVSFAFLNNNNNNNNSAAASNFFTPASSVSTFDRDYEFRSLVNRVASRSGLSPLPVAFGNSTSSIDSPSRSHTTLPHHQHVTSASSTHNSSIIAVSPMTPNPPSLADHSTPSPTSTKSVRSPPPPPPVLHAHQHQQHFDPVGRTIDFTSAVIKSMTPPPKLSSSSNKSHVAVSYENTTNSNLWSSQLQPDFNQQPQATISATATATATSPSTKISSTSTTPLSQIFSIIDKDNKGYVTLADIVYAFKLYNIKSEGRLEVEFLIEGLNNNNNNNNNSVTGPTASEFARLDLQLFSAFVSRLKPATMAQLRDPATWNFHQQRQDKQQVRHDCADDGTSPGPGESPRQFLPPPPTTRRNILAAQYYPPSSSSSDRDGGDDGDENEDENYDDNEEKGVRNSGGGVDKKVHHSVPTPQHRQRRPSSPQTKNGSNSLLHMRRQEANFMLKHEQQPQQRHQQKQSRLAATATATGAGPSGSISSSNKFVSFMKSTTSSALRSGELKVESTASGPSRSAATSISNLARMPARRSASSANDKRRKEVDSKSTAVASAVAAAAVPHYRRPTIQFTQQSRSNASSSSSRSCSIDVPPPTRQSELSLAPKNREKPFTVRGESASASPPRLQRHLHRDHQSHSPSPRATNLSNGENEIRSPSRSSVDAIAAVLGTFNPKTQHIVALCQVVDVRRRGFVFLDKMVEILQTISPSADEVSLRRVLSDTKYFAHQQRGGSLAIDYLEFVDLLSKIPYTPQQHQHQLQHQQQQKQTWNQRKSASPEIQVRAAVIVSDEGERSLPSTTPQPSVGAVSSPERSSQARSAGTHQLSPAQEHLFFGISPSQHSSSKQQQLSEKPPLFSRFGASYSSSSSPISPSPSHSPPSSSRQRQQQHEAAAATETLRQMLRAELDRVCGDNPQIFIDYLVEVSNSDSKIAGSHHHNHQHHRSEQHRNRDIWMIRVTQLEEALSALYAHKARAQVRADGSPASSASLKNIFATPPEWVLTRSRKIAQSTFPPPSAISLSNANSSSSTALSAPLVSPQRFKEFKKKTKEWLMAHPDIVPEEWCDVSYLLESVYLS